MRFAAGADGQLKRIPVHAPKDRVREFSALVSNVSSLTEVIFHRTHRSRGLDARGSCLWLSCEWAYGSVSQTAVLCVRAGYLRMGDAVFAPFFLILF